MKSRTVNFLLAALFAFAAVNIAVDHISQDRDRKAEVAEVVDGDTVEVLRNGGRDTVRILGIDTPEVTGTNYPDEFFLENISESQRCLRNIGEKASNYAREKLADTQVKVITDPQSDRRGTYGRLLAYIQYNQTDLGKQLLEKGYARVYNSSFSKIEEYRELETESREKERGIWNESCGSNG